MNVRFKGLLEKVKYSQCVRSFCCNTGETFTSEYYIHKAHQCIGCTNQILLAEPSIDIRSCGFPLLGITKSILSYINNKVS